MGHLEPINRTFVQWAIFPDSCYSAFRSPKNLLRIPLESMDLQGLCSLSNHPTPFLLTVYHLFASNQKLTIRSRF